MSSPGYGLVTWFLMDITVVSNNLKHRKIYIRRSDSGCHSWLIQVLELTNVTYHHCVPWKHETEARMSCTDFFLALANFRPGTATYNWRSGSGLTASSASSVPGECNSAKSIYSHLGILLCSLLGIGRSPAPTHTFCRIPLMPGAQQWHWCSSQDERTLHLACCYPMQLGQYWVLWPSMMIVQLSLQQRYPQGALHRENTYGDIIHHCSRSGNTPSLEL